MLRVLLVCAVALAPALAQVVGHIDQRVDSAGYCWDSYGYIYHCDDVTWGSGATWDNDYGRGGLGERAQLVGRGQVLSRGRVNGIRLVCDFARSGHLHTGETVTEIVWQKADTGPGGAYQGSSGFNSGGNNIGGSYNTGSYFSAGRPNAEFTSSSSSRFASNGGYYAGGRYNGGAYNRRNSAGNNAGYLGQNTGYFGQNGGYFGQNGGYFGQNGGYFGQNGGYGSGYHGWRHGQPSRGSFSGGYPETGYKRDEYLSSAGTGATEIGLTSVAATGPGFGVGFGFGSSVGGSSGFTAVGSTGPGFGSGFGFGSTGGGRGCGRPGCPGAGCGRSGCPGAGCAGRVPSGCGRGWRRLRRSLGAWRPDASGAHGTCWVESGPSASALTLAEPQPADVGMYRCLGRLSGAGVPYSGAAGRLVYMEVMYPGGGRPGFPGGSFYRAALTEAEPSSLVKNTQADETEEDQLVAANRVE